MQRFTLVLAGLILGLVVSVQSSRADTITYRVPGLSRRAEIVVDRWGIPHIYARTMEDLFFVQGFNAARDRLWQLDLWRRQGEGKLAEAFGERFVSQDRAARLFLYRGDLDREFRSYHPQGREILTAFTNGINAYIDLTRARPELLPIEFQITGARPGHWSVTSPLIRIFGLTRNLSREVNVAQLLNYLTPEELERLSYFQPPTHLVVPEGLDLSLINPSVIASYNLARGGVTFRPDDFFAKKLSKEQRVRWAQRLSVPPIGQNDDPFQPRFESNNWTISGRLTETGSPILAGDPHRAQSVPSLRYIAHLNGPGWNVIGAGEPSLPGISLGHNEQIAYSLTIFSFADEEDLYVYDTNPDNTSQYRYRGEWENMRVVEDTIPVRGHDPVPVQLKFTRHGPVLSEDLAHHKAYALRAAYLEHEGTAVYLASLRVDQAQNWEQFVRGMERHYTPSENMVYADADGNIGWFGCSIAPIRPNWNGMLPVPGDGTYEWAGFLDTSLLPRILNPSEGFFASANQYNIPENYPFTSVSGHEWTEPYRFNRILEVLRGGRNFRLRDSERLQYDEVSLPARDLVPFLNYLGSDDPDVQRALTMLRGWDYQLFKDSGAAAIYEIWVMQLHQNVFARYVPPEARSLFGQGTRVVLTELLRSPDSAFGKDPIAGRDAVVLQSLAEAVDILKTRLGPDMSQWQWGQLHHMTYEHQLAAVVDPEKKAVLNVGPLPMGGDGYTVHNTGFRLSDFNQNTGSSYREVMDLANWDRSVTVNSPGQSGDPNSAHYRDLFPLWAEGRFVPLLFSRDQIMGAAETIFILKIGRA